jgi:hypothetical protein
MYCQLRARHCCAHLCRLCLQAPAPAALVLQIAADAVLILLLHTLLTANYCFQALQLLLQQALLAG